MAIRDVVTLGFGSFGTIPYVTQLGFGANAQSLVGRWENVVTMQASHPRPELQAQPERLTLEAQHANN